MGWWAVGLPLSLVQNNDYKSDSRYKYFDDFS